MSSSLLLSREQIESNPDLKYKQAVFHHTAVSGLQGGDNEMENELEPEEHCPPLSRLVLRVEHVTPVWRIRRLYVLQILLRQKRENDRSS